MRKDDEFSRIVRLGGYLVLLGIVIGAVIGTNAVVNLEFFSRFVSISQYEATGFFLSVYLPSFVVIAALGYIFATTSSLKSNIWRVSYLSILSLVAIVLSALSVFNFISFCGGFLTLIGTILAYNRPLFKAVSEREACFLVEIGAVLIASFSTLLLLMGLVSEFLPTYLMGVWELGSFNPSTFFIVAAISLFQFSVSSFFCLRKAHSGVWGILILAMDIVVLTIVSRSRYVYVNLSGYLGVFMLIAGITSVFLGALGHIRLFFSTTVAFEVPEPSLSHYSRYCAYCGTPLASAFETFCSICERRPEWKPGAPFCPYCGRVIPRDACVCPHCQDTLA